MPTLDDMAKRNAHMDLGSGPPPPSKKRQQLLRLADLYRQRFDVDADAATASGSQSPDSGGSGRRGPVTPPTPMEAFLIRGRRLVAEKRYDEAVEVFQAVRFAGP